MQQSTSYKWFHWAGIAEGTSFLILLGIAMPLKYLAGDPRAVRWVGSAHGLFFVVYVLLALIAARNHRWPATQIALALLASILPFGPFWFDARLRNPATCSAKSAN